MAFIDVHAHLDDAQFRGDLDLVIGRAENAGVRIIVENSLDPAGNRFSLELSKKYPSVRAACGIYPEHALKMTDKEIDDEIGFIRKNISRIVGIGEIGLDYKVADEKERQKRIFVKFLKLAKETGKPVIVHSRNAEEDVIELLEKSGLKKVVMHCFGGNLTLVKRIAQNGWYFSIPANVVFSQHFQKIVGIASINQLLAETDCPYLSPFKGKRNEPSFVGEAFKKIAEIKQFELKEVENNLLMNYQRVF